MAERDSKVTSERQSPGREVGVEPSSSTVGRRLLGAFLAVLASAIVLALVASSPIENLIPFSLVPVVGGLVYAPIAGVPSNWRGVAETGVVTGAVVISISLATVALASLAIANASLFDAGRYSVESLILWFPAAVSALILGAVGCLIYFGLKRMAGE